MPNTCPTHVQVPTTLMVVAVAPGGLLREFCDPVLRVIGKRRKFRIGHDRAHGQRGATRLRYDAEVCQDLFAGEPRCRFILPCRLSWQAAILWPLRRLPLACPGSPLARPQGRAKPYPALDER